MTGPVPCHRCGELPVVRRVQTKVPGAVPVDLGLCACDYLRCPHPGCKTILRGIAANSHRCPHCQGRL